MANLIDLDKVSEPKFSFIVDGKRIELDPWDTSGKIEALTKDGAGTIYSTTDAIRKAFGFPTSDEIAAVPDGQEKPRTLTHHQCMVLQTELGGFIRDLDVSKKAQKLSQR